VGNVKELEAILAKQDKSKALNVLFRRGEWTQYAVIRLSR
jgi:serine protease Do